MNISIPKRLVIWLLFGVLGGLVVAAGFRFRFLTPEQTDNMINIGGVFWLVTVVGVFFLRKQIGIGSYTYDETRVRSELSMKEWKEQDDRRAGWVPFRK